MDKDNEERDPFELIDSEHILNLEFYLHRAILKWQDALETALKQGKDTETGLINRGLAGDMVEGIAKAKDIVFWDIEDIPEKQDKHRDKIIKNNEEAKDFEKKFKAFEKKIEEMDIAKNIKKVKISDYKVFEILKKISKKSPKKGNLIV